MINVLCYGDSNTWGYKPGIGERYSYDERWTGVLKNCLGNAYYIIEEGLNGRTTVWDDPIDGYKNGKEYLIPCIVSHKPLDLVILMLGTNDLKRRYSLPVCDIASGIENLIEVIQYPSLNNGTVPKILLLAPPKLGETAKSSELFEGGLEKSLKFHKYYYEVAKKYRCFYIDTSSIVTSSEIDGLHLEASEHKKLGKALATMVKDIFNH